MSQSYRFAGGRIRAPLLFTLFAISVGCAGTDHRPAPTHDGHLPPYASMGLDGMVVTEDSIASETAVRILRRGGNAVDAAVTAALVLAVTLPEAGNMGGGGFMVAYDAPRREFWALDFRETAPQASTPDMYERLAQAGDTEASTVGPLSAGIPGTPAGLYAAWQRGGSLDWAGLVQPAVRLARDGFVVGERLHASITEKVESLARFESTRRIFLPDGAPPPIGAVWVQRELAAVLQALALDGAAAVYEGPIAEQLVRAVREAGGIWEVEDLGRYRAVFREPFRVTLDAERNVELVTVPPPSSGNVVFAQTISFLRAQGALDRPHTDPKRAIALVEALRLAFADRNTKLGDPDHMTVSLEDLTRESYLRDRGRLLPARPPGDSSRIPGGRPALESGSTTHVVVIDADGSVVSLTTTLNAKFGSKWIAAGTGILLNDQMDDFNTRPGRPNLYGLVGSGANRVLPGARMLSSMSPSIVMRDGELWFALGARGGPRIVSGILQVILNRWLDDMSLHEAVAAPRLHHQWWPDTVFFEDRVAWPIMRRTLDRIGYHTDTKPQLGRVMAAERLPSGRYVGVSDPRLAGKAIAVRAEGTASTTH